MGSSKVILLRPHTGGALGLMDVYDMAAVPPLKTGSISFQREGSVKCIHQCGGSTRKYSTTTTQL